VVRINECIGTDRRKTEILDALDTMRFILSQLPALQVVVRCYSGTHSSLCLQHEARHGLGRLRLQW